MRGVGEAADGRGAVELVATTDPDVVLMDIMMPEMDGPTLLKEARAYLGDARVEAVALEPRPQAAEVEGVAAGEGLAGRARERRAAGSRAAPRCALLAALALGWFELVKWAQARFRIGVTNRRVAHPRSGVA